MKNTAPLWTEAETAVVIELAGKVSAAEIAKRVGRTKDAVKGKIDRMGLPKYQWSKPKPPTPVLAPPVAIPEVVEPLRVTTKPALRQKPPSHEYPPLEWCPVCCAPVADWQAHWGRMPECRKRA